MHIKMASAKFWPGFNVLKNMCLLSPEIRLHMSSSSIGIEVNYHILHEKEKEMMFKFFYKVQ